MREAVYTRICLVILMLMLFFSVYHFFVSISVIAKLNPLDLHMFLWSADWYKETGVLYNSLDDLSQYGPGGTPYKFPPVYVAPFLPFLDGTFDKRVVICNFYRVLHVLFYVVGCAIVIRQLALFVELKKRKLLFVFTATAFCLLYVPFYETLYCLSFEGVIFIAFAVVYCLQRNNFPVLSGCVIGFVAMMKLYPGSLILYAISRDTLKIIAGFILCCAFLLVFSVAVYGIAINAEYYGIVLPYLLSEKCSDTGNLNSSLCAYLLQIKNIPGFSGSINIGPYVDVAIKILRNIFLFFCVYNLWKFRKIPSVYVLNNFLIISFSICVTLLYLPNSWARYQIVLVLPVVVIMASYFINDGINVGYVLRSIIFSILIIAIVMAISISVNTLAWVDDFFSIRVRIIPAAMLMMIFLVVNYYIKLVDSVIFLLLSGFLFSITSSDFFSDIDLWYFKNFEIPVYYSGSRVDAPVAQIVAAQSVYVRSLFPVVLWFITLGMLRKNHLDAAVAKSAII